MTLVPLTHCCRLLALDPKTLRRWMKLAHLCVQPHPTDARKKCLTHEQISQLAEVHHRALSPALSQIPEIVSEPTHVVSVPVSSSVSPHLDSLAKQLDSLQSHIVLLEDQLALLTQQLQNERQWRISQASQDQLVSPENSLETLEDKSQEVSLDKSQEFVPDNSLETSSDKSQEVSLDNSLETLEKKEGICEAANTLSVDRRKQAHVLPLVEYGTLGKYIIISPEEGLLEFSPDSLEWFAWIAAIPSFRFVGKSGHFTAHHESRVPKGAWRAHRGIRNRSHTLRLAPNHELTIAVLEQAAQVLQARLV